MDYSEGKKKAVSAGTVERNKIDKLIKTVLIGLGVVVIGFTATIWAWDYSSRQSGTGNPPQVAGGDKAFVPPSNVIDVGLIPVDITEGGTRPANWNFVNRGDCINIYDGDMHFLGENCEGRGEFFDLRERGQIYITASRSGNVELTYNTW